MYKVVYMSLYMRFRQMRTINTEKVLGVDFIYKGVIEMTNYEVEIGF